MSSNPHFSTFVVFDSFHLFTSVTLNLSRFSALIMSDNLYSSTFVKFSDPSNLIAGFFANVFAKFFGNFSVDTSSDFIINLAFSLTMLFFFDLFICGQFLQDNFPILTVDIFSAFEQNVFSNHLFNPGYLLPFSLLPIDNFTVFFVFGWNIFLDHLFSLSCLLFLLLLLFSNLISLFILGQDVFFNHFLTLGPFSSHILFDNSIYDW